MHVEQILFLGAMTCKIVGIFKALWPVGYFLLFSSRKMPDNNQRREAFTLQMEKRCSRSAYWLVLRNKDVKRLP